MKVSYNWLQTYLDFPYSAEELSEILTQTGLEVESLENFEEIQGCLNGVVIGEVLTCEQHPDADKLKVTTVTSVQIHLFRLCAARQTLLQVKKL